MTLTLTDGGTTSATVHFRIPLFTEVIPTAHTYTYNSEFLPAKSTGQTTAAHQAQAGDVLEIYCTGLGALDKGTDGLSRTVSSVQVKIGGVPADVIFSGAAPGFAGLYQVNARVPPGVTAGSAHLVLTVAGISSNSSVVLLK